MEISHLETLEAVYYWEKTKYPTQNSKEFSLWRRSACQTLSKALDISNVTVRVAPDLLKALAILWDKTVRKSKADLQGLKPYWKSEKRPHFSSSSTSLFFTSFSKTNRASVFSQTLFLSLKCRDQWWDLSTIWKKNSFSYQIRVKLVCMKV